MSGKKTAIVSILLFIAAVTAVSTIYLLIDFHEADEAVKVFGTVQLVVLGGVVLLLALDMKKSKTCFLWGFYISSGLLSAIQTIPALLWILFHGQLVSERPDQAGVMAHWTYGAVHVLIIIWGLINAIKYGRLRAGGVSRSVKAKAYIPIIMCVCTSCGLLLGICLGNIILGLPIGVGVGLLLGIIVQRRKDIRSIQQ